MLVERTLAKGIIVVTQGIEVVLLEDVRIAVDEATWSRIVPVQPIGVQIVGGKLKIAP